MWSQFPKSQYGLPCHTFFHNSQRTVHRQSSQYTRQSTYYCHTRLTREGQHTNFIHFIIIKYIGDQTWTSIEKLFLLVQGTWKLKSRVTAVLNPEKEPNLRDSKLLTGFFRNGLFGRISFGTLVYKWQEQQSCIHWSWDSTFVSMAPSRLNLLKDWNSYLVR